MKKTGIILSAALLVFVIGAQSADAGYLRGKHYTLEEIYNVTRGLEKKHPKLVSIEEYGKSVEGRPLLAIRIARRDGVKRPEALITASIHAVEFTGDRVALAIAEKLIDRDGADPWVTSLLDRMDFYVLPLANPDGYARASKRLNRGFTGRRTNAHSVDLNRNFPYPKGIEPKNSVAGSHSKLSPNYLGPHPLSEPESRALDEFVAKHRFFVAIGFHTTGSHFVYPWACHGEVCKHKQFFESMGKAFNEHQKMHKYKVHQAHDWYQRVGDLDDWLYGRYGILSVTVEVAKPGKRLINPIRLINPFWWYNPLKIEDWIENDRDATMRAIEKAFELTGGNPLPEQKIEWRLPQ